MDVETPQHKRIYPVVNHMFYCLLGNVLLNLHLGKLGKVKPVRHFFKYLLHLSVALIEVQARYIDEEEFVLYWNLKVFKFHLFIHSNDASGGKKEDLFCWYSEATGLSLKENQKTNIANRPRRVGLRNQIAFRLNTDNKILKGRNYN